MNRKQKIQLEQLYESSLKYKEQKRQERENQEINSQNENIKREHEDSNDESFALTVRSLKEYIDVISCITDEINANDYKLLYRGQGSKEWPLLPSIARGKTSSKEPALLDFEDDLIRCAKKRLPSVFRNDISPVDLLALMQHYGIPTRLLDVSASPLVSLFFACQNKNEISKDGEVVVFRRELDKKSLREKGIYYPITPFLEAIAESHKVIGSGIYLRYFCEYMMSQSYYNEIAPTLDGLLRNLDKEEKTRRISYILAEICKDLIFVQSKEFATRQIIQQGEYILFPNRIIWKESHDDICYSNIIEPIWKNRRYLFKRIIITGDSKPGIIKELDSLGINLGALFSDSIEMVCTQITNDIKHLIPS